MILLWRIIQIIVPAQQTEKIISLKQAPGLIGIRVQKGICLQPAGDVNLRPLTLTSELSSPAAARFPCVFFPGSPGE